jgi:hypothetical protein
MLPGLGQQMQNRDLGAEFKGWITRMPAFTRFVAIILPVTYILSWFVTPLMYSMTNDPNFIFYYFEFWRWVMCPFVCLHIFTILIMACMFLPRGHSKEH